MKSYKEDNITIVLKELGIEITIIPHDKFSKFGRFEPRDSIPLGINEDNINCWVVKFSYSAIANSNGYDTLEEHGGTPFRYRGDKWADSTEIRGYYAKTDDWNEGLISLNGYVYPEEILWWFFWSKEIPSVNEVLQSLFSEFCGLEEAFNTKDTLTTLCSMLEKSSINIKEIDHIITIYDKLAKLYNRMKQEYDISWCQSSTGLGVNRFNYLREAVNNIN